MSQAFGECSVVVTITPKQKTNEGTQGTEQREFDVVGVYKAVPKSMHISAGVMILKNYVVSDQEKLPQKDIDCSIAVAATLRQKSKVQVRGENQYDEVDIQIICKILPPSKRVNITVIIPTNHLISSVLRIDQHPKKKQGGDIPGLKLPTGQQKPQNELHEINAIIDYDVLTTSNPYYVNIVIPKTPEEIIRENMLAAWSRIDNIKNIYNCQSQPEEEMQTGESPRSVLPTVQQQPQTARKENFKRNLQKFGGIKKR